MVRILPRREEELLTSLVALASRNHQNVAMNTKKLMFLMFVNTGPSSPSCAVYPVSSPNVSVRVETDVPLQHKIEITRPRTRETAIVLGFDELHSLKLFTLCNTSLRGLRSALRACPDSSGRMSSVCFPFRGSGGAIDLQEVASGLCPFLAAEVRSSLTQSHMDIFPSGVLVRTSTASIGPLPVQRVQPIRFAPKYFQF
jgi:hypothetical protein